MRKNIALVDDDRNILTSVSMLLEAEGFQIKTYADGASALEGLNQTPPDLGIFDIKMPRMDGMELLNRIRKTQQFPVIFLTSKDEEIDEVLGLRMGADDFIRKPFSQRLLLERIRAVLRRADAGGAKGEGAAERIVRGELVLDPSRHQCTWKGKEVHLTVTEFLLLKSLAERKKMVLYSSHVLEVVEKVCNTVLILRKGHVVAHDSVAQLREVMSESSLEGVFAQLTQTDDTDAVAHQILDVVSA